MTLLYTVGMSYVEHGQLHEIPAKNAAVHISSHACHQQTRNLGDTDTVVQCRRLPDAHQVIDFRLQPSVSSVIMLVGLPAMNQAMVNMPCGCTGSVNQHSVVLAHCSPQESQQCGNAG